MNLMKKKIFKVLRWTAALFFGSTILSVVVLRFVPVFFTPLMFIRCGEQLLDGKSLTMHHHWVSIEKISPHLPVAVMAIQKAAKQNMRGGKKMGASTISQQTAKNVFLWPGRSWIRKGFEMYFTALIELMWSKQRIMEVYLNSIEMGDGIYGADAVAEYNFGTTAGNLSRAQCALIAATLPNPRVFSSKYPSAYMRKRQHQIMKNMRFMPAFPKEGEDYNPNTASGGVYRKKK